MAEIIGKIKEFIGDVRTGVNLFLLARRYSRRHRGITTKSLKSLYGED